MKPTHVLGCTLAALLLCAGLAGLATAATVDALSNSDVSAGLKKALDQSINNAVGKLGVPGGFLDNPKVKIPLPPKLEKAQGAMRMLGMGKQADDLVTAMNRAAEAAVPESKVLLKQALHQMTLEDAKHILTGGDDSATQYFKTATYAPLEAKFKPIIDEATRKVKLAELGVLKPEDGTIESYVTQKTLDGLFIMMAEEERAIRKDPLGQASDLLKKVFGALR